MKEWEYLFSFMAKIDGEDALDQPSAYHTSEAYVTKKGNRPEIPTYLKYLCRDNA